MRLELDAPSFIPLESRSTTQEKLGDARYVCTVKWGTKKAWWVMSADSWFVFKNMWMILKLNDCLWCLICAWFIGFGSVCRLCSGWPVLYLAQPRSSDPPQTFESEVYNHFPSPIKTHDFGPSPWRPSTVRTKNDLHAHANIESPIPVFIPLTVMPYQPSL